MDARLLDVLHDAADQDVLAVADRVDVHLDREVQEAVEQPREISEELVKAYLARRALDYLVGFNLSPLLWKKAGL